MFERVAEKAKDVSDVVARAKEVVEDVADSARKLKKKVTRTEANANTESWKDASKRLGLGALSEYDWVTIRYKEEGKGKVERLTGTVESLTSRRIVLHDVAGESESVSDYEMQHNADGTLAIRVHHLTEQQARRGVNRRQKKYNAEARAQRPRAQLTKMERAVDTLKANVQKAKDWVFENENDQADAA